MKHLFSILIAAFFSSILLLFSCKKENHGGTTDSKSPDKVTAVAYQYNTATKKISPQDSIVAQIQSDAGVRFVYTYLLRSDKADSLINVFFAPAGAGSDVSLGISPAVFSKINMTTATGLKLMIKHPDNTYHEDSVKITPFTPPLPEVQNFPATILPDEHNIVHITGKALSENGIKTIYIYDDATGSFTKVDSIINLNNATSYNVDYSYTYRDKAANVKVQVVDNFDLAAEAIIGIPVLPYNIYKDITMNAQGFATNNAFITQTATLLGSCDLLPNEATMDFLFYGTSSGPTFYAPDNTANVAKNYKCDGTAWTIGDATALKATRFRVLIPGSSSAVDDLYTNFAANNIPDLSETGFFNGISVPSGKTARAGTGSTDFNTTTAYLVWVRIPQPGGSFRNCLIRAKDVVSATSTSTIKFDIYVQK